ncbi:hypothetical protein BGW38_010898 [Lunasporangiospora selenospora]|uniref:Lipase n=1 Tax=Lunasporangiospora selenospora TaxID=979761 RepID=A0A9P6FX21_9FUNG|nr:hypothetical protein BGW38_010898 [Lunasporangiospora selenospora]
MRFSSLISVASLAAVTLVTHLANASPLPIDAKEGLADASVSNYVPLSKRSYTADDIEQFERIEKRSTAGFNDWSCKPSKAHPTPIVLVHGLIGNGWDNWLYMAPRFVLKGYCVFSLTYGKLPGIPLIAGLDSMETSAQQLSTFIDKVLTSTNSTKVNLLGHSQGSLMPRYYLKFLNGASKVDKYAAFGTIAYGTNLSGLVDLAKAIGIFDTVKKVIDPVCKSCLQFLEGSDFLKKLNEGGDTVPGVQYKYIVSAFDQVVTPYTNGYLRDKNPLAKNVKLQDLCMVDLSDHVLQMADPIVFHSINSFFDSKAPQTVNCLSALW